MKPRRPRLRSLKYKLALVFCLIAGGAMAGIWFYVLPQLRTSLVHQRRQDLFRVATITVLPLRDAAKTDFGPHTRALVRAVADSGDARLTLYGVQVSRGGKDRVSWIPADSQASPDMPTTNPLADRAARTRRVVSGYVHVGGATLIATGIPLSLHHVVRWVAFYTRPLTGVDETVALIRRQLLVAGAVTALLALVGAYLVAGVLGRRMRRLERAALRLAAGQFVEPLPVKSVDELGQLTEAFNDMQVRLSRVDRARKEFVANASHELRTPLFSLGGFIELLEDEELDPKSRAELLSAMHGQVDRLQKLAVDLLDLSRLDAGSFELERERVDLADVAEMVVSEFKPGLRHRTTDLQLKLPEGDVEVVCDRERMAQIVRILVDNAIRHTPEGTHVTVSTSRRNGSAKVTVADTGPGLDSGAVTQVFDRFYTGDADNGGAGLGLAIAKELAERMHGEIRLRSRPGRTAFTFEMPTE